MRRVVVRRVVARRVVERCGVVERSRRVVSVHGPVSVLSSPRDRDPGFNRAPMLTGAPNKVRGRSAQLASELKAKGR